MKDWLLKHGWWPVNPREYSSLVALPWQRVAWVLAFVPFLALMIVTLFDIFIGLPWLFPLYERNLAQMAVPLTYSAWLLVHSPLWSKNLQIYDGQANKWLTPVWIACVLLSVASWLVHLVVFNGSIAPEPGPRRELFLLTSQWVVYGPLIVFLYLAINQGFPFNPWFLAVLPKKLRGTHAA